MFTLIPAFKYGWQEMQKRLWTFLVFTLIYSLINITNSYMMKDVILSEDMGIIQFIEALPHHFILWTGITSFFVIIVSFFIIVIILAGLRGVPPMTYLRTKIARFPQYLVVMILKMLAIGLGLLAFLIPGLIIFLALYFVEYLVIDREMSVKEAFRESWNMTRGFRAGIFFFEVNLFIIGMILSFPQSVWPDTIMTYAILTLINVVWLPVSWNAQGWIYQFVSQNQINR